MALHNHVDALHPSNLSTAHHLSSEGAMVLFSFGESRPGCRLKRLRPRVGTPVLSSSKLSHATRGRSRTYLCVADGNCFFVGAPYARIDWNKTTNPISKVNRLAAFGPGEEFRLGCHGGVDGNLTGMKFTDLKRTLGPRERNALHKGMTRARSVRWKDRASRAQREEKAQRAL